MTDGGLPSDRLNRILTAVETIDESLGVLTRKQRISRADYKTDSDTRDIVERRFVKMTEAAIDIAEELVKYDRGQPPGSVSRLTAIESRRRRAVRSLCSDSRRPMGASRTKARFRSRLLDSSRKQRPTASTFGAGGRSRGTMPSGRGTSRLWGVSRRSTATIDDTEVPAPAIVDAVAEREGVDEAGLHSLYDAIGPDILEILHESDADSGQSVTFESHGDSVTVRLDGSIVLDG
ncbi:HalOD1 output domain-containing protein [Salinigranum marinum]|uniref:HalOD1 output domain-containing protein n=1 Tax=Salinigranum marinum TaxID=1515595 RepID=UPI002989DFA6|nr:HalOD1 output domain-containing protein [Salinigranum marinum]